MGKHQFSARGEKAAIGGYLPQFDTFARFAYSELVKGELEWIKLADPEAEKLDDIQYSTRFEVHAYQIKWTIANAKITYSDFKKLLPLITASWQRIKKNQDSLGKKVIPHLLTNKALSSDDRIKLRGHEVKTFTDFFNEVWHKLKTKQIIDDKWESIIKELKKTSLLNDSEFEEFVKSFEFYPAYEPKEFSVSNIKHSKEDADLQNFSRFIVERVAAEVRQVKFRRYDIIKALGWESRFKTTFNHDLILDRQKYHPILSTQNLLNIKLNEYDKGYIFLIGGPGTGKSSLLTNWAKNRQEQIIKYYAFDFTSPSSQNNYFDRGKATNLFFDLVLQIKQSGTYEKNILPDRDLKFLKEVFFEQLNALKKKFKESGEKTILIIDGLDHVPREYKSVSESFLAELPLPSEIPQGVYIVLGSQSYELEDLPYELKNEYRNGNRNIQIDALNRHEVFKYIETSNIILPIEESQKQLVFEKSQGHPLYLSYIIEKIRQLPNIIETIDSFIQIDGDIDIYYNKIWEPIQQDDSLIRFIGLITRINGSINVDFLNEWKFENSVKKNFSEKAKFLFDNDNGRLRFFHNSFRQFLLHKTALNYLSNTFDRQDNIQYHKQLADYYKTSRTEQSWGRNFHLFYSEQFDQFISEVTPDSLTSQFLKFRPVQEINVDAKLGVEIAKLRKDVNLLVRYFLSLAEIERRTYAFDSILLVEELLELRKPEIVKKFLRSENTLYCSEITALKAARLFIDFGDRSEGYFLFNLAYPSSISDSSINISNHYEYNTIRESIEEWVDIAPHFLKVDNILSKINNILFTFEEQLNDYEENELQLKISLLKTLCYSLIDLTNWIDLNYVIQNYIISMGSGVNPLFNILKSAIEKCITIDDRNKANEYLSLLLNTHSKETSDSILRIYIADLVYKVTNDITTAYEWIKDIPYPSNVGEDYHDFGDSLHDFAPLIKLNKLLIISGNEVPITTAIPSVQIDSNEKLLVDFERMLCLITQILSEGITQNTTYTNLTLRVAPIIHFYYTVNSDNSTYKYRLKSLKEAYFDFLINSVSKLDQKSVDILGDILFRFFMNLLASVNFAIQ